MSSFGQYVHLHWKNYETYGTYEKRTVNKEGFSSISNFQENIFKKHRNLIQLQARSLKNNSLKTLEDKYNKLNYDAYTTLKGVTSGEIGNDTMKALLALVNKSWSDDQITRIMESLQWKNDINRLVYTGSALATAEYTGNNNSSLFARIPETTNASFYAARLFERINKINVQLRESFGGENPYETELRDIQTNLLQCTKIIKEKEIIENGVSNIIKTPSGRLFSMDTNIYEKITKPFNDIMDKFVSTKSINEQLAYRIPEILGQIGTSGIQKLTNTELLKALQSLKSTGSQLTTKTGISIEFLGMDQEILKEAYNSNQKNAVIASQNGDVLSYSLREVGEGRQQKADIEWVINSNNPSSRVGISMKSTHMQNINSPYINLQSSSLMLYLAGLQNMQTNLGNHYLNILAEHKDKEEGKYNKMRKEAEDALTLAIAYSALTGANQLRSGGQASILAIYDRAVTLPNGIPRVRFLDMGVILEYLNLTPDAVILNPSIDSIKLNNKEINGNGTIREKANKRITALLVEVRATTIAAQLSKQFLNSIYRK